MIGRALVICLIAVALIGLGFGATSISEKWLSPFLVLLPLYLCLKLEAANADTSRSIPRLLFPVAALALGFVAYIALGNVIGPLLGNYTKENLPSGPFIGQLVVEQTGAKPGYVITDDPYLAASARLELPRARVLLPSFGQTPSLGAAERSQPGLVVWQSGRGETLDALRPYLQANGVATEGLVPATKAVPYLFSGGRDSVTFGYAWVEPGR